MTQKFGRNYRLTIDVKDGLGLIVIEPPLTMRFWVRRDILSSVNNASIDVYNLSLANRRRIFQDRNNLGPANPDATDANGKPTGRRSAKLEVGYGGLIYTVWQGDIWTASSAREGVDIVTRIESLTGIYDLAASQINLSLPAGTTLTQAFQQLAGQMPNTKIGYISNFPQTFGKAVVLNGKPWDLIQQYAQGIAHAYIDNDKIFIMSTGIAPGSKLDVIASSAQQIPVFNADTGLLETPRREQALISITTLLEANVQINSVIQINSVVEPAFDGQYSVVGLQHSGTISGAVNGDARSIFFLLRPQFLAYNLIQPS
jgi:hypothetical protein